ncbi:uroporphyrinogen-III synthase [Nonlabens sp. Hel1_33_55]|uniref:uroporphyrinogen-III synthase n=1 Tax=Nonlabens sp. Hel1_33_55 TaxID=1336802 RepID=UPI000875EB4A|nr:uroporphyrinogen-III synthase [Nonlabens sp. Hel1_33_55]SCY29530.1 uroporphyrinogen-III synthase [Nonlabens sp. Hel1_33_55]
MSATLLSTKLLTLPQQQLVLNSDIGLVHYDILRTDNLKADLSSYPLEHVIITSKNATHPITDYKEQIKSIYCVGSVTADALKELEFEPKIIAKNARELALQLVARFPDKKFTYLCSDNRRDELPDIFKSHKVSLNEVIVYESSIVHKSFDRIFEAVLFYSPRGVYAFAKANKHQPKCSICIGETTAAAAKEHFENVHVANKQTIENVLVTAIKILRDDKK